MLQRLLVRDWVRVLPDVARLVWRVVRDERVPVPVKVGLGGLLAYVALPIDVIPDWVPLAGRVDDALIASIGLRALLRRVPDEVLIEHWRQAPHVLGRLLGKDTSSKPWREEPELIKRGDWKSGTAH
jgi:uncharacterized membrane protein YkvA (DUF1232 family)